MICKRNRFVLTDEEDAEYRSFEAVIKSMKEFQKSTVMLCTFHGIWMAFKKDLISLLSDCQHGQVLGEYLKLYLATNSKSTNSFSLI